MDITGMEPSRNVIDGRTCDYTDLSSGQLRCIVSVKGDLTPFVAGTHVSSGVDIAAALVSAALVLGVLVSTSVALHVVTVSRRSRRSRAALARVVPRL